MIICDTCLPRRLLGYKVSPIGTPRLGSKLSANTELGSYNVGPVFGKPCTECVAAQCQIHLPYQLRTHARLLHVDIFETILRNQTDKLLGTLFPELGNSRWAKAKSLDLDNLSVSFPVDWTLPAISKEVFNLLRRNVSEKASKVGTLSSPHFASLVQKHAPEDVAKAFQLMLYATSLSYVHSDNTTYAGKLSVAELQELGAQAGHAILRYLERELCRPQLSRADREKGTVLFLLTFGTILAIRYTSPALHTPEPEEAAMWDMMKQHLCRILAHYLVDLGMRLGASFALGDGKRIIENVVSESWVGRWIWRKTGNQSTKVSKPPHLPFDTTRFL